MKNVDDLARFIHGAIMASATPLEHFLDDHLDGPRELARDVLDFIGGATPWMTTAEAARYARLSTRTLEGYRRTGDGPVYHRQGARVVLYRVSDLDAWLARAPARNTLSERLGGVALGGLEGRGGA